jgi:methyltransferase (TIGR00027 family)
MMTRSDNDSWDLATSVGATATVVAAHRAVAARNSLIDDPYAEPLVRAVNTDAVTRLLDGGTQQEDGTFTVQQAAEAMAVRTRFYDELFTTAVATGVRQAVILASGLDTRAYRLRWPAGTVVYELDQPTVIEFKTETLARLGAHPTAERRAIGVDLRNGWPKALLANGFDRSKPAAWIAEGLTIYLAPEAQDQLFDDITRLSAPGSHLATEYLRDAAVFSDSRSERVLAGYRSSGLDTELTDLVYAGRRSDVLEFLTARGWEMSSQTLEEAYAANGFELPGGDMFAAFAEARIVKGLIT